MATGVTVSELDRPPIPLQRVPLNLQRLLIRHLAYPPRFMGFSQRWG